jgi:hypothetical protein
VSSFAPLDSVQNSHPAMGFFDDCTLLWRSSATQARLGAALLSDSRLATNSVILEAFSLP